MLKYDSVFEQRELNVADIPAFIPLALSEMFVFNASLVVTALLFTVAAFSEKLSFKVEPISMALSFNTYAVSFSRTPVFHALLARTDPLCFADSFRTETVFIVPALTVEADEASAGFRLPALDQRLAVKSVGGVVSVTAVNSCVGSTSSATYSFYTQYTAAKKSVRKHPI